MAMKLYILGSGGWIPTKKRHTCTFLLENEKNLILLDTGTGISRLNKYKQIIKNHKTINIIYSHYHLDHIIGLAYLPNWLNNHTIRIWGPGLDFYGKSCREILTAITSTPYFALPINKFSNDIEINDYNLKGFTINNEIEISICAQQHSDPSFGISIGNLLHYATDTNVIDSSFKKAQGVKMLLHECWQIDFDKKSEHSSVVEILHMAAKYNIQKIGLIHINPNWKQQDEDHAYSLVEKGVGINILSDGDEFNL
jgi:ribonuclease BN (tRNA processing enzyme)